MPEIIVKLGDNIVQKYFFFQEPLTIGRSADNEIVIENLAISRNHAQIRYEEGRYFVTDLDSSNGTYVNGVRVKKTEIMDKDVVSVGKHKIYFYDSKAPEVAVRQPAMQDSDSTMLVDSKPEPELEAALIINKGRQKGQRFVLANGITSLGRGSDNDIRLTDWFVSKQHAQIERRDKKFVLRDLGSWRHTFLNGEAVQESPIRSGDILLLGPTVELLFEVAPAQSNALRPAPRVPQELESAAPAYEQSAAEFDVSPADSFDASSEAIFGEQEPQSAAATELPPAAQPEPAEDYARQSFEDMSNGATGVMPLDAIGLANPFEEIIAEREGQNAPQDEHTGESIVFDTGRLTPEDIAEPAPGADATGDLAASANPAVQPQAPASEPADAANADDKPLVTAFADHREDKVDAVYEDLAEASLLAAATSAGAASAAANGGHSEAEKIREEHETPKGGRNKKKRGAGAESGVAEAAPQESPRPAAATAASPATVESASENPEVAMWERALNNKSEVIRKQAARRLKQLTGRDYAY